MNVVALRMLFGDRTKYLGLVFGIAFATLLIAQQSSIFVGLMMRTGSFVNDVREADIWVMDTSVRQAELVYPMRDTELSRVRSTPGLAWAVPLFKANANVRTPNGSLENATIIGVDDTTLIGVPPECLLGKIDDLRQSDAIAIDRAGYILLWPDEELQLGKTLEMNDRRAVIVAIVEATAPFNTSPMIYSRYSLSTQYVPVGRNQLSFIVARAVDGADPKEVSQAIQDRTGLKAMTRPELRWFTVNYYLTNTGIPVNFGAVIILGVIVGIAVVGLTFNVFVSENIKQYAALKAIGVRNSRLIRMVLMQAAVVGAIGYSLGLLLAVLFFSVTGEQSIALRGFFLPWQIAVAVAIIDVFIMLCSTLFSMRRVLFVDPATVFRG